MAESFSKKPSPQTWICKLWRCSPKVNKKFKTWGVDTGLPLNTVFGDYGRLYNCDASMFGVVIKARVLPGGFKWTSKNCPDLFSWPSRPPELLVSTNSLPLFEKKNSKGFFGEETNMEHVKLVGGWTNPFEKFESKWPSSPIFGVKTKNIWITTIQ